MQSESCDKAYLWDMLQTAVEARELWRTFTFANIEHK